MQRLQVQAKFDPDKCRQYLNGELTVFHCHHYATLFTQLADDAKLFNGAEHLKNATSESMFPVIKKYCEENNITSTEDKISIAEQYYSYVGLGKLKIDLESKSAEMENSHIDEGWIKKWGKRDSPVNFVGHGYIASAFALANNDNPESYDVKEIQSIVSGAESSKFVINKK